jgi:hypothetical protein
MLGSYINCDEDETRVKDPTTDTDDDKKDEPESSKKAHRVTKGARKDLWPLAQDANGRAILPRFEGAPGRENLMDVIRSFVTHAYRKLYLQFLSLSSACYHNYRQIYQQCPGFGPLGFDDKGQGILDEWLAY